MIAFADPGDEDLRPAFRDWLDMFCFIADTPSLGARLTSMLVDEMNAWKAGDA